VRNSEDPEKKDDRINLSSAGNKEEHKERGSEENNLETSIVEVKGVELNYSS
jgi:hypothetical protein